MMQSIKYLAWRWLICPWRVYYHLKRHCNNSAAIQYVQKNTRWPLRQCANYVYSKRGHHVYDASGYTYYKIGPVKLWEYPRRVRRQRS